MDYLKSSVLFYLYHSLYIVDDVGAVIAQHVFYDLNLLKSDFINSSELGVRTGVSTDMINI